MRSRGRRPGDRPAGPLPRRRQPGPGASAARGAAATTHARPMPRLRRAMRRDLRCGQDRAGRGSAGSGPAGAAPRRAGPAPADGQPEILNVTGPRTATTRMNCGHIMPAPALGTLHHLDPRRVGPRAPRAAELGGPDRDVDRVTGGLRRDGLVMDADAAGLMRSDDAQSARRSACWPAPRWPPARRS